MEIGIPINENSFYQKSAEALAPGNTLSICHVKNLKCRYLQANLAKTRFILTLLLLSDAYVLTDFCSVFFGFYYFFILFGNDMVIVLLC